MSEQEKPKRTTICWINSKTLHIEGANDKTLCGVSITPMWTGRLGAEFETTCKKCAQKAGEEVLRLTSVATQGEEVKPKRTRKNKPGAGGRRERAGRPTVPESEHMVYTQITWPANVRDFAKSQPGGASAYIRRLIEADQNPESRKTRT